MSVFVAVIIYYFNVDDRGRIKMIRLKFQLKSKERETYAIHYSCERFYDGGAVAPVICAISLVNFKNREAHTFSLHNYLIQGKSLIESEQLLLRDFIEFYKTLTKPLFVHWAMDGLAYGFKAIYARASNFGFYDFDLAKTEDFNLSKVVNSSLFKGLEENSCKRITVLPGKDEALCFGKRDFNAVMLSTEGKAFGLADLFEKYLANELFEADTDLIYERL